MSAIFLGAGQAYNGDWAKAGLIYLIYFADIAILINAPTVNMAYTVALTLIPATYLYGLYDAYTGAEKINNNLKLKYGVSSLRLLDISAISAQLAL